MSLGLGTTFWTLSVCFVLSSDMTAKDHSSETMTPEMVTLRRQIIAVLDDWVDIYINDQNYITGDVRHGQFHNSDNMRMQECTQLIAWAYANKDSRHYARPEVLDGAIWSIDYMVRAQGNNGGFNEYHGWCGAPERTTGKSSVTGFTLYAIGRSIAILTSLPEMRQKLSESIDTDGRDGSDTPRVEAWRKMLKAAMENQYSGTGRGHAPNQDACALAAVFAMNEAWEMLSPGQPPLKTQEEVAALRDEILFGNPPDAAKRPFKKWFTNNGLLLEPGKGFVGYDANYAQVALAFLALCARRDEQVEIFLHKYCSALQHFYVPDSTSSLNVGTENGISRRVSNGGVRPPSVWAIALSRNAHPAGQRLYSLVLDGFKTDVSAHMRLKSPHHFQISSYLYTEWLDDFDVPENTDYLLPTEQPGPWEFRDEEAETLVQKTADNCLIYYTEHWEDPETARRHIWGQEPEDIPSEKCFYEQ